MKSSDSSTEGSCLNTTVVDETSLEQTSMRENNPQMLQKNCVKRCYSRKELEGLRNAEGQMKKWTEVYCGLGPLVQEKYDALVIRDQHRSQKRKKLIPVENPMEITFEQDYETYDSDEDYVGIEQDYDENDNDSDKEYIGILKPAFYVSGEPDFESGPPEDGLEYLRRVRWEAARLPNVKIAKVDDSLLCAKQTNYMPRIPAIAKCPDHLMPLKEWEDAFLADFSDLRMALSSNLLETVLDDYGIDNSANSEACPTLSTVMRMDSVARVSALKKRVSMAESASNLSRSDFLWLFVLSAAVDSPLDADTSASFRALLRKCATLRAEKSVMDEQVVMLNILVTISGRYFGQAGEFESRKRKRED